MKILFLHGWQSTPGGIKPGEKAGEKGISPIIRHSWLQKLDLSPFLLTP
jgi:hypothetical protein